MPTTSERFGPAARCTSQRVYESRRRAEVIEGGQNSIRSKLGKSGAAARWHPQLLLPVASSDDRWNAMQASVASHPWKQSRRVDRIIKRPVMAAFELNLCHFACGGQ